MQKSTLETFIRKYSLDGICEASHWYSDSEKQTLTVRAQPEVETVILKVVLKKWEGVETCRMALPSASKVKSMLSPISEDITITLNKIRDRVASFMISDQDCEAICTVAEFDAFPEALDVDTDVNDNIPTEFDVEMKLTAPFVARMMKSISALKEAKDFVLMNNKKGGLDMVINYEDINTNRIRLPVETVEGKDKLYSPMAFSTSVFKAILASNERPSLPKADKTSDKTSDADQSPPPTPPPDPVLKVSVSGIAIIGFEDDLFRSTYFMFPTRNS